MTPTVIPENVLHLHFHAACAELRIGFTLEAYDEFEGNLYVTITVEVDGELGVDLSVSLTTEDLPGQAISESRYYIRTYVTTAPSGN
ncbi:MAG: hypothetical protein A6F71_08935 [Cycloclasticus sp. symbiont of Poecilosclerida sp. M]|nr:MAG: hypothetical protein A6F71_08935 [Cycloclasticus sp. symbiont of Poecilosclerida sp. M]